MDAASPSNSGATRPNLDLSAFADYGYVVVPGLVGTDVCSELCRRIDGLVAEGSGPDASEQQIQLQHGRDRSLRLVKISQMTRTSPALGEIAHSDPIVDVVEQLIGTNARIFRDVVVVKPARTGGALSMHQDSAYWDVQPMSLVSAWIALTDAPQTASCLSVVPGSHHDLCPHGLMIRDRWRVPDPVTNGLRKLVSAAGTGDNPEESGGSLALWKAKRLVLAKATAYAPVLGDLQDFHVLPETMGAREPIDLPIAAGDAVFFHSLLIHGTSRNVGENPRYAAIVSYMPDGARCGRADSKEFPRARMTGSAA